MKAFEPYNFKYPEEMKNIIRYFRFVTPDGKLNVDYAQLEELYKEFSRKFYCSYWIDVTGQRLYEFLEYLSEREIED